MFQDSDLKHTETETERLRYAFWLTSPKQTGELIQKLVLWQKKPELHQEVSNIQSEFGQKFGDGYKGHVVEVQLTQGHFT